MGCGGGVLAEAMAHRGASVTGIDLGAASRFGSHNCICWNRPARRLPRVVGGALAVQHPGAFDIVTCMEMLEHVPAPASVVRACATLVKLGGWVFFSTLIRNPKSFALAIVGAEYVLRLFPAAPTTTPGSSGPPS